MKYAYVVGLTLFLLMASAGRVQAADRSADAGAYATVARERAHKIVSAMALTDPAKAERVVAVISRQYEQLHAIHEARDQAIAAANKLPDRVIVAQQQTAARKNSEAAVASLHGEYLARLAQELKPEQSDQVKDGMTYGVLPLTYRVYQEMLPNLTAEQKAQILAWLTEAREHAMDGGSSDEKHAWFGKYKGKINNYLSAAGIDMKAAEKNLAKPPGKR